MATTAKESGRETPMLRQYFEMKSRVPDAILFYRMGDFYEMFFEDAREAAPLLGIALTARNRDSDIEAPMCGVPWHAAEHHIARLVAAGRKVAVCDQVEDPRAAKGLVRRDITRIVTPGTVLDPESLLPGSASYLAAVLPSAGAAGGRVAVAFLDFSTGQFHAGDVPAGRLADVLALFRPREVLLPEESDLPVPAGISITRRSPQWFARWQASDSTEAGSAAAAAKAYAEEMRPGGVSHVGPPSPLLFDQRMSLDASAISTLEIFESSDGSAERSLCAVIDRTRTPPGARALKDALSRPSTDPLELEARWEAVEELTRRAAERQKLQRALDGVGDLERRLARISTGTAGPREVAAFAAGLRALPGVVAAGETFKARRLRSLLDGIPDTADLVALVERTIAPEPPVLASAGGAIRDGADKELDELRSLRRDGQGALLAIEAEERRRSGISNLRVRYNRVFGYNLEVGKAHRENVPSDWIRRQSLANAERFVTPALKELEEKILGAEERIAEIEARIYSELLRDLAAAAGRASAAASGAAALDLHASFAEIATSGRWTRPKLSRRLRLSLVESRHPVVEALRREEPFVPNDCELTPEKRILVVTGPNMGGKSTYLRQVATAVLLAQAGSFVPASSAEIPMVDRIFTRVGAADHLARGESTFMVEMLEAAAILREATARSLVILDEVGRGTSTFDGLSIAWALVEHLHDTPEKGAFVLFATHYHELTEIALVRPGISNATMAVKEIDGRVVFLRKVVAGTADRSYGIHVAELAGLPKEVTRRAREILSNLEKQELDVQGAPVLARHEGQSAGEGQMLLFSASEELVLEKLRQADVNNLTPVAALSLLAALQERLKKNA
ncbi:MAG TPA: DNA mismatch repair protein MutS [Thermoanaerobaculia bacterium]|nr:DNA mismatch repair protein MutS [Thermoanaerobaculia bacterium]